MLTHVVCEVYVNTFDGGQTRQVVSFNNKQSVGCEELNNEHSPWLLTVYP